MAAPFSLPEYEGDAPVQSNYSKNSLKQGHRLILEKPGSHKSLHSLEVLEGTND